MRPIVFRPQAEDDALEARAWYEARRAGLGKEFGMAVDELVSRIAANPLAFPLVHKETRRAVLSRFPYAIYCPHHHSAQRSAGTSAAPQGGSKKDPPYSVYGHGVGGSAASSWHRYTTIVRTSFANCVANCRSGAGAGPMTTTPLVV